MLETEIDDERAIRDMVDTWMAASKDGDVETVLGLMTDDVLFLTAGREPFGKQEFRAALESMKGVKLDGQNDIQEIEVFGNRAWMRNRVEVTVTPTTGESMKRCGYTLTILRKVDDGCWRIARDANLMPSGGG
jgi:uncharacterized protein (TIGR02246 family)